MEGHVAAQNARLASAIRSGDRAFLRGLELSPAQIETLMKPNSRTFAMQYGNAMERAVGQAFEQDCALRGMVADTRNASGVGFPKLPGQAAKRPDFTFTSGPMQGNIVDLTTAGGRAAKMAK